MVELKEENLSLMRRYPLEVLITALFLCVSVLSGVVYSNTSNIEKLHKEFETYVREDNKLLIEVVNKNTIILNQLNDEIIFKKRKNIADELEH